MARLATVLLLIAFLQCLSGCRNKTEDLGYDDPPQLLQLDHDIPIVYDSCSGYLPLHKKQYDAVVECARKYAPPGQQIWFLLVQYNSQLCKPGAPEDFRLGQVFVYFTPDRRLPRLRTGRCMYLSVCGAEIQVVPIGDGLKEHDDLWHYAQVPAFEQTFAASLDLPSKELSPFPVTGNPADGDLIQAIDLARGLMRGNESPNGITQHIPTKRIQYATLHPDVSITIRWGDPSRESEGGFAYCVKEGTTWRLRANKLPGSQR